MSDTLAPPTQKSIDYMVRLLQMNPVQECEAIVGTRSTELGQTKKSDLADASAAGQAKTDRQNLLTRLDELRAEFWTLPLEALQARLTELDTHGYADVSAAVARLRIVAAHREEFPKLAEKLGFDRYIVDSLKDILTKSPREVATLKEHELATIANGAHRGRGRHFVRLVKRELPEIYKLEADWFNALFRQKVQGKTLVGSARRGVAPAVGAVGASRGKWWFVWIGVVVIGRIVALIPSNDRKDTIPYRAPGRWEQQHPISVPDPPAESTESQGSSQKALDTQSSPTVLLDNRVWDAYPTPYTPGTQIRTGDTAPKVWTKSSFLRTRIQPGPGVRKMADTPAEPDWSLLPRDPVRFFGLPEGFDRRDLKRRYNKLIRRFKPERNPEEFQKIRAAYEQLDSGIRYGLQTSWTAPAEEFSWSTDVPTKSSRDASSSRSTPGTSHSRTASPVLPLHERLQRENVHELYRELESKAAKTAFDFYALAVMSDVVARDEGKQFARWLLEGLVDHPNDIGLLRLLNTYLRTSVEAKNCAPLLVLCSQIVHENTFFLLTEPLWRLMLKLRDFAEFRTTLQQCESNLKGVSIDGRIAFYIQMLKSAMWVADEAWIDESLEFVEKNFARIPQFLDFDVELVTRLRTYIKHRSTFSAGHPLLRRMDQALRDYFCEEQQTGDRSVLECQVQILQDSDALSEAFTNLVDPAYGPFYAVWGWVSHDVAERNIEGSQRQFDENLWFSRTRALMVQIAQQTDNSRLGLGWMFSTFAYRVIQGLIYVGTALLFTVVAIELIPARQKRNDELGGIVVVMALVAGVFAAIWLTKQLKTRAWFPYCRWIAARCYRKLWRPEIFRFLGRSHLPYRALVAYVANSASNAVSRSDWVRHFVEQDFALPVYSIAQRFIV